MKISIFTEGGRGIGLGHLTRCYSLAQALSLIDVKSDIEFITSCEDNAADFISESGVKVINSKWQDNYDMTLNFLNERDSAIIDSYIASKDLYYGISKSVNGHVIMIDDFQRLEYPEGIVVNPSVYGDKLKYPQKEKVDYLLGKNYVLLRNEFREVPQRDISEKVKSVMLTLGGIDSKNMTSKILEFLAKEWPGLVKRVIIGKSFKHVKQIESFKDGKTSLIYSPDVIEMKSVMNVSDLAISAAGQTLYELLRMGIPTIAISVAENQMNNIKGGQNLELIEYAGWWQDEKIIANIRDAINKLTDRGERMKKYQIGKKTIDGKGSVRVIKHLLSSLQHASDKDRWCEAIKAGI